MENQPPSIHTIENLLTQISAINKKYESIAEITGENFNIFRILRRETREVETHSAFIAELLNPKGSHGMKDAFLKLFVKQFEVKNTPTNQDDLLRTEIKMEEVTNNGRIDIVIKFRNRLKVVIENKIYADDQGQQLVRYCKDYPGCHLFYLTLFGINPSHGSITWKDDERINLKDKEWYKDATYNKERNEHTLVEGIHFFKISYQKNILEWLELCQKEAATKPLLRETIAQYIYLIKHLTHQTMSEVHKNEIIEAIVNNPDYIESAEEVQSNWTSIRFRIIENVMSELSKLEVCKINNLKFETDPDYKVGMAESSFYFFRENWRCCICFEFTTDFEDINYGITNLHNPFVAKQNLYKTLSEKFAKNSLSENWYWVNYFDDCSKTDWRDVNNEIPGKINEKIKEILTVIDSNNIDLSM